MPEGHLHDDRDVEQILKLAVRNAGYSDEEALRQRLQLAGAELGLTDAQITAAEAQYYKQREEDELKKEFEGEAWHEFKEHLASYAIVNAGLFAFDFFDNGRITWAYWPLIGWGIGIAFHAYGIFFPSKKDYEKEFAKWSRKRQRRERRRNRQGLVIGVNIGSGLLSNVLDDEEEAKDSRS